MHNTGLCKDDIAQDITDKLGTETRCLRSVEIRIPNNERSNLAVEANLPLLDYQTCSAVRTAQTETEACLEINK